MSPKADMTEAQAEAYHQGYGDGYRDAVRVTRDEFQTMLEGLARNDQH